MYIITEKMVGFIFLELSWSVNMCESFFSVWFASELWLRWSLHLEPFLFFMFADKIATKLSDTFASAMDF